MGQKTIHFRQPLDAYYDIRHVGAEYHFLPVFKTILWPVAAMPQHLHQLGSKARSSTSTSTREYKYSRVWVLRPFLSYYSTRVHFQKYSLGEVFESLEVLKSLKVLDPKICWSSMKCKTTLLMVSHKI